MENLVYTCSYFLQSEHIFQVMKELLTEALTEGRQEEEEVTPERRSSRQSSRESSSSGSTTILPKKCISVKKISM